MTLIATLALIGSLQASPSLPKHLTSLIELRPPQGSDLTADYLCPGTRVRARITSGISWVKVTGYSASAKKHAAANLEEWNRALEPMGRLHYFEISCQGPNEQLFSIYGWARTGGAPTWVSARFSEGRLVQVTTPKK